MNNINFSLPIIGTTVMSTTYQNKLIINQPTAIIVGSYLEHMNAAIAAGLNTGTTNPNNYITPTELAGLINTIQTALLS